MHIRQMRENVFIFGVPPQVVHPNYSSPALNGIRARRAYQTAPPNDATTKLAGPTIWWAS